MKNCEKYFDNMKKKNYLWSIRMRASKSIIRPYTKNFSTKNNYKEIHISGAEGLYDNNQINTTVKKYIKRALTHSKGYPDKIIITIEKINRKPIIINSLPITTIISKNLQESKKIINRILYSIGISDKSIKKALEIMKKENMRGASILTISSAKRLESDQKRGVRVSRLGISKEALKTLSKTLQKQGINTDTVREAIILASKVNSHKDIIAELCVSDDPEYTTGYIASKKYGYVRIPFIKKNKSKSGGRVFFVSENVDLENITNYLERTPVMVKNIKKSIKTITVDELLSQSNN